MQVVTTGSGIGRLEGQQIALLDTPFQDVGALLRGGGSLDDLREVPVTARVDLNDADFRSPLGAPAAVWGVGLNYRSKAAHTGRPLPVSPILFLAASSAVQHPGAAVPLPMEITVQADYEAEIAVVVGRRLYHAEPQEVWDAVAGITTANDMTARDVMRSTKIPSLAKSFPGFKPLGPSVGTLDELPDRDAITVQSWVNGQLCQDDTSAGLIFPIPDLLARLSWYAPLDPGDVVLTGTPAGTGQDRDCFLSAGDHIRVQVGSLLPLHTTIDGAGERTSDQLTSSATVSL